MLQVMRDGSEVNFQHRLVKLLLEQLTDAFKLKYPGTFQQDGFKLELGGVKLQDKLVCGMKKAAVQRGVTEKNIFFPADIFPDADEAADLLLLQHGGYFPV